MLPRVNRKTRTFLLALALVTTLAATPLLPPSWTALGQDAEAVRVPAAREGDQATYDASGDGLPVPQPSPGEPNLGFERLPPVKTTDRWGTPHDAQLVRMLLRAAPTEAQPDPDRWVDRHQAFAGVAHDPIWLSGGSETHLTQTVHDLPIPLVGRTLSVDENVSAHAYIVPPYLANCAAHHGLQGATVTTGEIVPLERLCPGLRLPPGAAQAEPARMTTFRGRAAAELTYRVPGEAMAEVAEASIAFAEREPHDLLVRAVLAEEFSHLAELEARTMDGAPVVRLTLLGFLAGEGQALPAWRDRGLTAPDVREGARVTPLHADGPQDGGSGLPYTLEEALANLRNDASLVRFQDWRASRPDAYVAHAEVEVWSGPMGAPYTSAAWNITMSAASGPQDAFFLRSTLTRVPAGTQPTAPHDPNRVGDLPRIAILGGPASEGRSPPAAGPGDVVANEEFGPGASGYPAVAPTGEPVVDVASALVAWSAFAPDPLRDAPPNRIAYSGPVENWVPMVWFTSHREMGDGVTLGAFMLVDLTTGTPFVLLRSHTTTTYGLFDLSPEPVEHVSRTSAAPLDIPEIPIEVVAVGVLAAFLAALAVAAHTGFLSLGYARITGSALLDNPVRKQIHDLVVKKRGIHQNAIAAELQLGDGTVAFHLRVLQRGKYVKGVSKGRFKRYYATGAVPHSAMSEAAALADPVAFAAYQGIRAKQGVTVGELAKDLGFDQPKTTRIVDTLEQEGILKRVRDKRFVRLFVREIPGWS